MASSLELNKLLAGVLTAGVIAVGAGVFSGLLYHPRPLTEHAFSVVVADDAGDVADAEAVDEPSIEVLLASADPSAGQTITRQCTACHVFNEGGDNRVGPYLWDVVGRDIASVSGFSYSGALQEVEGEWTFEALDGFLANPRDWAPGTSMSYAGLRSAEDRANLIAYLREQSTDPVPLPEPGAETAAAPPAEVEAAAEVEAVGEPAAEVAAAAPEVAAAETVVAVEGAAEATEEVVEETVAAAEAGVEVTAVAAEETAEEAAAAVEETAAETVAAAEEAVEETVAAAEEAVEAATEAPAAEEVEVAAAATGAAAASPMVAMVAAADPADGQRAFRQCAACHTVDQGGQNRVGPNLWGTFGADVGQHEGFNYSDALLAIGGIWTVETLNAYLENPRGYAPGNRMAFAGLRSEEDRAAVIAYLRSLSEDPQPVDIE